MRAPAHPFEGGAAPAAFAHIAPLIWRGGDARQSHPKTSVSAGRDAAGRRDRQHGDQRHVQHASLPAIWWDGAASVMAANSAPGRSGTGARPRSVAWPRRSYADWSTPARSEGTRASSRVAGSSWARPEAGPAGGTGPPLPAQARPSGASCDCPGDSGNPRHLVVTVRSSIHRGATAPPHAHRRCAGRCSTSRPRRPGVLDLERVRGTFSGPGVVARNRAGRLDPRLRSHRGAQPPVSRFARCHGPLPWRTRSSLCQRWRAHSTVAVLSGSLALAVLNLTPSHAPSHAPVARPIPIPAPAAPAQQPCHCSARSLELHHFSPSNTPTARCQTHPNLAAE